jgi:transposase
MCEPTFTSVCVVADTIVGTVEHGVAITNAAVDRDTTVVFCDLITTGPGHCPACGAAGIYRDTVVRRVTDVPVAGHPMMLRVRVPRYRCTNTGCEREVFSHDTDWLAPPAGRPPDAARPTCYAAWVTHAVVGCAVAPRIRIRR